MMMRASRNSPPEDKRATTKSVRFPSREIIEADHAKKKGEVNQKRNLAHLPNPPIAMPKMVARKRQADHRKISGGSSKKNDGGGGRGGGNDDPKKPKRPLSAYNLFFRHERERILAMSGVHLPPGSSENLYGKSATTGARLHRKTHGLISFKDLARAVAAKWKAADTETRRHFDELAAEEKRRYLSEMERYKMQEKNGEGSGGTAGIMNRRQQCQQQANAYHHYPENNTPGSYSAEHAASALVNLAHQQQPPQQPPQPPYTSSSAAFGPSPREDDIAGSNNNSTSSSSSASSLSVWAPLNWRSGGYPGLPSVPLHSQGYHHHLPPAPHPPPPPSFMRHIPPPRQGGCQHADNDTYARAEEPTNITRRPRQKQGRREHYCEHSSSVSSIAAPIETSRETASMETGDCPSSPSIAITTSSFVELLKSTGEEVGSEEKWQQQRGRERGGAPQDCNIDRRADSGNSPPATMQQKNDGGHGGGADLEPLPYWRMGQLETMLHAQQEATISSPEKKEKGAPSSSGDDEHDAQAAEEERAPRQPKRTAGMKEREWQHREKWG